MAAIAVIAASAPRPAAAADECLFAVTTDYETSGQCATIGLESPWPVTTSIEPTSSDPVVRFYRNKIYVINRLYADNIQVLDPDQDYGTILEFSVGAGSNPQDIAFMSETRAYITRYESVWLYEVNPSTGAILDSIDLTVFADADGLPEMSQMVIHDDRLFVQLHRVDRGVWVPASPAYLAVIDITTNQIVDVDPGMPGVQGITLTGLNPTGEMVYDGEAGTIDVAEVGNYLTLDGGIERVDCDALAAEGFIVTEAALGGDVGVFDRAGTTGFVAVSDDWFFTIRLVSFSTNTGAPIDTLYTTDGYVPDVECDVESGQVFLADRKATAPGVQIFDIPSGAKLTASPRNTGLPPADLVVVRPTTIDVAGGEESEMMRGGRATWAQPNPFRQGTTIFWRGDDGGEAGAKSEDGTRSDALIIYDIRGRIVRTVQAGMTLAGYGSAEWDGRDDAGRPVAPGIYLYRAAGAVGVTSGRLVLTR